MVLEGVSSKAGLIAGGAAAGLAALAAVERLSVAKQSQMLPAPSKECTALARCASTCTPLRGAPIGLSGTLDVGALCTGAGGEGDGEEAAVELPEDLRRALEEGLIDADVVERLEALRRGPVMRQLMRSRAFRDRALADPDMVRKAWVEQGISTVLVLASELKKRGDGFLRELDYVIANFIVGRVTNFLLFAIMAPTLELSGAGKGPLRRYLAALPPYALARSPAGAAPYTAAQRAAAVVYKGLLLGSVGFTAGIVGTGITAALLELNRRRRLRAGEAVPAPPRPRYLFTGLAWFAFMSTASNLRLQAVNGVEGEVYRRAAGTALPFATTVALRLVNTYLGVSQWIDFVRAIGLQPKPKPAAS
eukprot:tig00021617_g22945.t1